MKKAILILAALAPLALVAHCGNGSGGQGTVRVTVYGEDFIEQSIPADAFADGWTVTFDAFLVNVGGVTAAGQEMQAFQVFDLTQPGPVDLGSAPAPAGPIAPVAYTLAPADGQTTNVNAPAALFDTMVSEGYAVYVSGTATRDASEISFSWGFTETIAYQECHAVESVETDGQGVVQLTFHGDHLFYDSLVEAEPGLRFDAYAQADDGDGELTLEELENVSGTAFSAMDHYDVPPDSGIADLRAYLTAQVTTIGHIDGEGHCH
jgi:hypothetical protein